MRHGSYDKLDADGFAPPVSIYFFALVVIFWRIHHSLYACIRDHESLVMMSLLERQYHFRKMKLKDNLQNTPARIVVVRYAIVKVELWIRFKIFNFLFATLSFVSVNMYSSRNDIGSLHFYCLIFLHYNRFC